MYYVICDVCREGRRCTRAGRANFSSAWDIISNIRFVESSDDCMRFSPILNGPTSLKSGKNRM